jgi:hypothetical protein
MCLVCLKCLVCLMCRKVPNVRDERNSSRISIVGHLRHHRHLRHFGARPLYSDGLLGRCRLVLDHNLAVALRSDGLGNDLAIRVALERTVEALAAVCVEDLIFAGRGRRQEHQPRGGDTFGSLLMSSDVTPSGNPLFTSGQSALRRFPGPQPGVLKPAPATGPSPFARHHAVRVIMRRRAPALQPTSGAHMRHSRTRCGSASAFR